MVWFKIILSAIASLAALKVLYKKVNLSKSNIWCQNNSISFLTFLTYFIFPNVSGIALEKNCVYMNILQLAPILFILKVCRIVLYK